MRKVICYPKIAKPETFESDAFYFELLSVPEEKNGHVGHSAAQLLSELRKSGITPSISAFDFALFSLAVASADKAILREESSDGWTRQIDLTVYIHEAGKWNEKKALLEDMLRFLTGDFWYLHLEYLPKSIVPEKQYAKKANDCLCLLSGGMDSLAGAINLHVEKRNPLFVSQTVRGDAEHQKLYASSLGTESLCQWSGYIRNFGKSENSTRARSIVFFAYALLASCGILPGQNGRKELYVPENGFISLNIPMNILRTGSLSTKTTHPVYMQYLQEFWDYLGVGVDLIMPFQFKTKGEVLAECKDQKLLHSLIFTSTSCGKYLRHGSRHCGVCVPCLVRRASFIRAGMEDLTERGYEKENLKLETAKDLEATKMACAEVAENGVESLIKSALSFADPEYRNLYRDVVKRGIDELTVLLKGYDAI